MRKLVLFMHCSLDGFVTGPKGELDWVLIDDGLFEYAYKRTEEADTALYGRVTYQLMNNYWPNAAEQPNATKHDIEHSAWYNKVEKIVISSTLYDEKPSNARVIKDNLTEEILSLKRLPGKDILMFGSPTLSHWLMSENLIDDYWLFINPVLLGQGIPLFKGISGQKKLDLVFSNVLESGVVCLHYQNSSTS